MIYAQIDNPEEIRRIDEALSKAEKKNWYRRLMIIKFSATKQLSVPELAQMFNLCQPTIRYYIHTYNTSGLDALVPQSPPGCTGKITHVTKTDWDKLFEQTPDQYDRLNTDSRQWTLELIQDYLQKYHQISVTISTIHNALKRTGRGTGRSKLRVGSPDPDYQVKRETIQEMQNLPSWDN